MSIRAQGSVVDEDNKAIAGLRVVFEEITNVLDHPLGKNPLFTGNDGTFTVDYPMAYDDPYGPPGQVRKFRLRLRLGQHVLKEEQFEDVASDVLTIPTITIPRFETTSQLATLGQGYAPRFTRDNAIVWRPDNVSAWGRAAELIRGATKTVDLMELEIAVDKYEMSEKSEQPEVVLDFPDKFAQGSMVQPDDAKFGRVERLLLDAANRDVQIRIQLPVPTLDLSAVPALVQVYLADVLAAGIGAGIVAGGVALGSVWGLAPEILVCGLGGLVVLVAAAAAIGGFFVILNGILDPGHSLIERKFRWDRLADWFKAAGERNAKGKVDPAVKKYLTVKPCYTRCFSIVHAKILLVDDEALVLGSPLEQGYFNGKDHKILDPRRGRVSEGGPIHDNSISVRGPATGYLREVFNMCWDHAAPSGKPVLPKTGPLRSGEFSASVQVVRSVDNLTFKGQPAGEKGCLEAYLRMFHFARKFIYLENQYFTPRVIREALIEALTAHSDLKLIMVLNIKPDLPYYTKWQRENINAILHHLGEKQAKKQLAVFTTWSHTPAAPKQKFPKPRLIRNYVHSKSAIIDNVWATVGSANLDGSGLTAFEVLHAIQGADFRNTEANCVIFDPDNPQEEAVDALRRLLWAEHLGLAAGDKDLAADVDFIEVWNRHAQNKVDALISDPDKPTAPHVLPWPIHGPNDGSVENYLRALGVKPGSFDLRPPQNYNFKTGKYKSK